MGNFDFVRTEWPEIHEPCARAESYVATDPRAACFYSRRAIELLVNYLYDLKDLPEPYQRDLSAHINAAKFAQEVGRTVTTKLNYLRKLGNDAVHQDRDITARDALGALKELFHVMIAATYRNFAHPENVPTGRQLDPQLARRAAPAHPRGGPAPGSAVPGPGPQAPRGAGAQRPAARGEGRRDRPAA